AILVNREDDEILVQHRAAVLFRAIEPHRPEFLPTVYRYPNQLPPGDRNHLTLAGQFRDDRRTASGAAPVGQPPLHLARFLVERSQAVLVGGVLAPEINDAQAISHQRRSGPAVGRPILGFLAPDQFARLGVEARNDAVDASCVDASAG